jgi:Fe2+ transport system protein FeoA
MNCLLPQLEPGSRAVVTDVGGDPSLAERLQDLGFVPETPITVIRRAPLGDPTEYELRGYRLCLRRSEGNCIRVRRT